MSDITLTFATDENRPHSLTTFAFVRGFDGEGNWVTTVAAPQMPANCIVHIMLQSQLTKLAHARKMKEPFNFGRNIPKPVKEVSVRGPRGPRKPKAPKNGLIGGFNPFAMTS